MVPPNKLYSITIKEGGLCMPNELDDLTIKEAAKEMDVSYTTVLNMVSRDQIKAIRRGGNWRIPRSEWERFKKEGNHPDSRTKTEKGRETSETGRQES